MPRASREGAVHGLVCRDDGRALEPVLAFAVGLDEQVFHLENNCLMRKAFVSFRQARLK